jgi:LysR family transcriptional regulator, transcriptional activator of nhaA
MEWLNYHHLLYFWLVAREGSLARACAELRLAPSTVSKQIHLLEGSLGHPLFAKSGRRLALTESGRVAFRYADEIFGLGRELRDALADRPVGRPLRLTVGVADALPKLVAQRLLAPALEIPGGVRLLCREGQPGRLLAELALHELDVVLADAPASPEVKVRAFSHLLGSSGITFFARPDLARTLRRGFPASLEDVPLLLPAETTALRRRLDQWFDGLGLRPTVAAEFEDTALLKAFGLRGAGAFPAASVIAAEVARQYGVRPLGRVPGVEESYYALTVERRIKHPAVVALCERARGLLQGPPERAAPGG